jgi:hypothetical protein
MKKILTSASLMFTCASLFAQISLTYKNNALVPGDKSTYRDIQFIHPGQGGANQIWDFSKLQYTGTNPEGTITDNPTKRLDGASQFNVILKEAGAEYFFNFSETGFEEKGYVNQEKEISLVYTDPVQRMKYPFAFGDHIGDTYSGFAMYKETTRIDFQGEYTVDADAFGTLILPDMLLKNVLRVKVTKKGLERNLCGSTEINTERYFWYAPGYRYPVLTISILESQSGSQIPDVTRTAAVNTTQPFTGDAVTGVTEPEKIDKSDVSVILYPNPFTEKLTYNYFLRKDFSVSIDLYDITGKVIEKVLKTQSQVEGLHTGDINASQYGLKPGIYYLRFTFDNKVITNKIVKI